MSSSGPTGVAPIVENRSIPHKRSTILHKLLGLNPANKIIHHCPIAVAGQSGKTDSLQSFARATQTPNHISRSDDGLVWPVRHDGSVGPLHSIIQRPTAPQHLQHIAHSAIHWSQSLQNFQDMYHDYRMILLQTTQMYQKASGTFATYVGWTPYHSLGSLQSLSFPPRIGRLPFISVNCDDCLHTTSGTIDFPQEWLVAGTQAGKALHASMTHKAGLADSTVDPMSITIPHSRIIAQDFEGKMLNRTSPFTNGSITSLGATRDQQLHKPAPDPDQRMQMHDIAVKTVSALGSWNREFVTKASKTRFKSSWSETVDASCTAASITSSAQVTGNVEPVQSGLQHHGEANDQCFEYHATSMPRGKRSCLPISWRRRLNFRQEGELRYATQRAGLAVHYEPSDENCFSYISSPTESAYYDYRPTLADNTGCGCLCYCSFLPVRFEFRDTLTCLFPSAANDESLQKYNASLGIQTGASNVQADPKVDILSLGLEVEGRPDLIIDLTAPGALDELKNKPFTIKEGATFRMKVAFKVEHQIISGLKYLQVAKRMGLSDKLQEMIGSYAPNTSEKPSYEKKFEPQTAPSGMIARGHYNVASRFLDDDSKTYLQFNWSFDIKKDWA